MFTLTAFIKGEYWSIIQTMPKCGHCTKIILSEDKDMTNPSRVAFTLFGRDVYWYGVLMAIGILLAV